MRKSITIVFLLVNLSFNPIRWLESGISNCYATSLKDEAINYRRKGYEAQMLGDLDLALSYYQKATQIDPYYVSCYNDLGIVYEMKGWPDRAEEVYLKAIQLDPNYLPSYSNLALLYERKNNILKAAEFWRKRVKLGSPREFWTEKAKEKLRKALQLLPPELKKEILEDEAAEFSKEILGERRQREQQRLAKIKEHFDLGMSYYLKGNYEEAKEEFYEASILDPENPEIRKFLDKSTFKSNQINIKKYAESGIRAYSERNYLSAIKEFEKILTLIQPEASRKK